MEFRVLGPLEVVDDGGEPLTLGGPKQRAVLALLALDVGRVVSTDRLVDGVWGDDPPDTAGRTLQVYVSNLRKVLGADTIVTQSPGYRLALDGETVDLVRFRRLVDRARDAVPSQRAQLLTEALGLWRGAPLSDLADLPLAQASAAGLEEERLAARESRINAELELGRHQQLIPELESLTTAHPLRERLRGQLMLALYRAGRQADALAVYDNTRETLAEQLGLDPSAELRDLHQRVLEQDTALRVPEPSQPAAARPPHQLPVALTSFVGRDHDVRAIFELLDGHRLVTLTGVGGVGKTRLAVEAARGSLDDYPDGVWLVELAPVTDPSAIAKTVATTLELIERPDRPVEEILAAYLRDRDLLLLLDNCEHLLDATALLVADLLTRCPTLHVLATSREGLGVPGERLHPVHSLAVPPVDATVEATSTSEAVELFVDRASEVDPGFALEAASAPVVADICRQLDGIPLAIELAAARTSLLSPQEIGDRLEDRFHLLTGRRRSALPRHQTLEAAIDWSYELLSEQERAVLRRLSVFRGGFTLPAAEDVTAGSGVPRGAVLDALGHLVEQSLVTVERADAYTRYDLLETIRQYASARLHAEGDPEAVHRRHLDRVVTLAEHAGPRLRGPDERSWFARLGTEYGNIRAAVTFALDAGLTEQALRVLVGIGWFLLVAGHGRDGRDWLDRALELDAEVDPGLRARGLLARGLATVEANPREGGDLFAEARELAEAVGDTETAVAATLWLGAFARLSGDYDRATALNEQASETATDDWVKGLALQNLAILARYRGDLDHALELHERGLEHAEKLGSPWAISFSRAATAITLVLKGEFARAQAILEELLADARVHDRYRALEYLNALSQIALARREPDVARHRCLESMRLNRGLGGVAVRTLAITAAELAQALHELGEDHAAAQVAGFTAELQEAESVAIAPDTQTDLDEALEAVRAGLGDDVFEEAFEAGRQLDLSDVLSMFAEP